MTDLSDRLQASDLDLRDSQGKSGIESRNSDSVIKSFRYSVNPNIVYGYGSWGVVYAGRDELTGQDVAIKVFSPSKEALDKMSKRGLDENKAMDKEALDLSACSRVVPRRLEVDDNGRKFIVMPYYHGFLDDMLGRLEMGGNLKRPVTWQDQIEPYFARFARDIATAYQEVHSRAGLNRVHGDGHPGNFAINSEGHLLLNDFGASTIEGLGMTNSPRDNIGWFLTRAPELFHERSHPTRRSDVYSASALIFKLQTGEYPLEGLSYNEIRNSSGENLQRIIDKRIKSMVSDRRMRKFFSKGLSVHEDKRFDDGSELKSSLEKSLDKSHASKEFRKYLKRFGLVSAAAGLLGGGIYASNTIPVDRIPIPRSEVRGLLYQPKEEIYEGCPTTFVAEENREALEESLYDDMLFQGFDRPAKMASKNKTIAYFCKSSAQTNTVARGERLTDYQAKLFARLNNKEFDPEDKAYGPYFPTLASSIEVAINECKDKEGRVDVEDVMIYSRYGPDKLNELKRRTGSSNYSSYKKFLDEDKRKFIDIWLAYYHQDI